jgi:cell wall-associated NlpC family hydrolase
MFRRRSTAFARLGVVLIAAAATAACATGGGTPRPFPTPDPRERLPAETSTPAPTTGVLDTALALVGTPYRAGGQSPQGGFDCSGFVTWVFGQHGVILPRTVGEQYRVGERLASPPSVSGADLVFFATGHSGASHVGIALGDGRFVHAPSSRGVVRIESLGARYWAQRFVGARRVLRAPRTEATSPGGAQATGHSDVP